jgi:hypothetical protein
VILAELGGPDRAHEGPGQVQTLAQGAPPELDQEILDVLGRSADPPHHELGVGPETHGRIGPSDRDPVRPFLEQDLGLVGELVQVFGRAVPQVRRAGEHRVVRVRQLVHEISSC